MASRNLWPESLMAALLLLGVPSGSLLAGDAGHGGDWREVFGGARISWLEVEDVDDGDLNIGVFGGGRVLRHVAISGGLDYHTADFDLERRETYALTAGLEVYPMKRKVAVQPYLLGGAGLYFSEFKFEDCCGNVIVDDSELEFGFHAGGGMDITLTRDGADRLALNLELRRIFTDKERGNDQVEPDGTLIGIGLKIKGPL